MLAAYLRGLLKPEHKYGLRSILAENVILEAISAEITAETYTSSALADASLVPALRAEAANSTIRSLFARLSRAAELKFMDVYRLEKDLLNRSKSQDGKPVISLYQLYHAMTKSGIMQALHEDAQSRLPQHDPED